MRKLIIITLIAFTLGFITAKVCHASELTAQGGWLHTPNSNYGDSGGKTFATKDEALARADELKAEYEAEENCRFMAKTKDHRSWAWNATYHRQCAEKARKELAYHENKARI